ncbi:MAG TPA: response regulator [Bryobacteraceae bacterium]|jgi:CheY-like chemotaxis protein
MDTVQKLIQAVASLLWPVIVIFLLFRFKTAIAGIIESARSRKFTLKVGGQELTMEEANQVQQNLIADLQNQVSEIKKNLGLKPQGIDANLSQAILPSGPTVRRLLWVDDNPKNNSYFVEQLSRAGVTVDLAGSTGEALKRFNDQMYDYVISDMGRLEGLIYDPIAGIGLLKAVRSKNAKIPFVIFCSTQARHKYGDQALALGATAVTSSPTELVGLLRSVVKQTF